MYIYTARACHGQSIHTCAYKEGIKRYDFDFYLIQEMSFASSNTTNAHPIAGGPSKAFASVTTSITGPPAANNTGNHNLQSHNFDNDVDPSKARKQTDIEVAQEIIDGLAKHTGAQEMLLQRLLAKFPQFKPGVNTHASGPP